jgi:hypothetical protein
MEDLSSPPVLRSILWSRRDRISLEYFQLYHAADDIRLSGTVLTLHEGEPLRVEYMVHCDRSWVTRAVRIGLTRDTGSSELTLIADDHRRWWSDGKELAAVAGCVDVDISLSPSTNTLPIRRLSLARGEASDVTAAWIRFPELTVEPLPQRYVRTGDLTYRYASAGGAFTADIEVDELGLVVRYPPAWQRVAG